MPVADRFTRFHVGHEARPTHEVATEVTVADLAVCACKPVHESDVAAHGTTVKLTGSRCKCAACGQLFNAVSVFDRHRVGGWEDRGRNRRCLTVTEMLAKGWRMNTKGFWIRRFGLHLTRRSGDRALPGTLERA